MDHTADIPATHGNDRLSPNQAVDLLARCQTGEETAWTELYAACIPPVRRRALRMGFSEADAQDICQQSIMALAQNIQTVENPLAFVQKVASRRCIDRIRRKKPEDSYDETPATEDDRPHSMKAVIRVWIEKWHEKEHAKNAAEARLHALEMLRDGLITLGEPCRGLLKARFYGELAYKEIARACDIPEPQVGVRLGRCIQGLKKIIQSDGHTWANLLDLWSAMR